MEVIYNGEYMISVSTIADGIAKDFAQSFIMCKNQVHGTDIWHVDEDEEPTSADALLTRSVPVAVRVADCHGVVIMGQQYYAVVHAGRKGVVDAIVVKVIHRMEELGEKKEKLSVFVGPSIRSCCFEVQEDFLDNIDERYVERRDGKIFADTLALLHEQISDMGITDIIIHDSCTKCESDTYRSHRSGIESDQRMIIGVQRKPRFDI